MPLLPGVITSIALGGWGEIGCHSNRVVFERELSLSTVCGRQPVTPLATYSAFVLFACKDTCGLAMAGGK